MIKFSFLIDVMKLTVDIKLIQDTYLQIYSMCMTMFARWLCRVFPLHMFYTLPIHCNLFLLTILLMYIILSHYVV
jgi:hypothetical protein